MVTNDAGAVVYAEAHDPYGGIQKTWVNSFEPKRKFSDKERDEETGLDYFGARYYAHMKYRWISIDPLLIKRNEPNPPAHWNLYSYCLNNPLRYKDPTGRVAEQVVNIFLGIDGSESALDLHMLEKLHLAGYKVVVWDKGTWSLKNLKDSLGNNNAWTFYIGHSAQYLSTGSYVGLLLPSGDTLTKNEPMDTNNENVGIFACNSADFAFDLISGSGSRTVFANEGKGYMQALSEAADHLIRRLMAGDGPGKAVRCANEVYWNKLGFFDSRSQLETRITSRIW